MTLHLVRSFQPGDLALSDDHVLSGRLVPYNEVADVVDLLPDGAIDRYREAFDPGSFARQVLSKERGVVNRIHFRHMHDRTEGLGFLGNFGALRDMPDGLYGDVPIISSRVADVDGLIRNGVDGISIEFHSPKGGTVERDGVRWRTRAVLWAASLVPVGAFVGARVLSFRDDGPDDDDEHDDDETPPPPPASDETPPPAETDEDKQRAAVMDPDYWAQARARQIELNKRYRPPVISDEAREREALHDATIAAYHAR